MEEGRLGVMRRRCGVSSEFIGQGGFGRFRSADINQAFHMEEEGAEREGCVVLSGASGVYNKLERMKVAVAVPVVICYIAAVFFGPVAVGPGLVDGVLVLTSVLFIWAYLNLADGRLLAPIALVALLTLVTPLVVLAWISLPTRHTWGAALGAVLLYFRDKQPFWGLGIAAPTAGAIGAALVIERVRRSKAKSGVPHAL